MFNWFKVTLYYILINYASVFLPKLQKILSNQVIGTCLGAFFVIL